MATGTHAIQSYEGIGFRIRKVGEGTLDLGNLVLGLRGDDAFKVFELPLADAVNPDGEPLEELTEESQLDQEVEQISEVASDIIAQDEVSPSQPEIETED